MNKQPAFSQSIDPYLRYTKMPWGQLFYNTAWQQIDRHLSPAIHNMLDVGCGFGITAHAYAARGNKVTGVEPTPEMVGIARQGETGAVFIKDSFEAAADGLGTYDWVLCHNILEYVDDPQHFLKLIADCQNKSGYLSLIAHNPTAKVMKKAVIDKDPEAAQKKLGHYIEYSGIVGTEITTYPLETLKEWLSGAGYSVVDYYGIHNVYGYVADNTIKMDKAWNAKMSELEQTLAGLSPYRDIAIFTHLIAQKDG